MAKPMFEVEEKPEKAPVVEPVAEAVSPADERIKALEAKIAELEAKGAQAITDQRAAAMLMSNMVEVPAGKIKVKRLDKDGDPVQKRESKLDVDGNPLTDETGKPIYKFVDVYDEVDCYEYRVELPPSGGTDIKINGVPYYHGVVYKFTIDQLRTVKEMIARSWSHEASISGSNENFYRAPKNTVLRGGARA